ncbi:hypothetical protein [Algoriphagus pacificus]|uniref:Uncharacterized protein n=1 Tax=Algoriphagus pacificus TaxID=2811234 RepID=A0ABS3CHC2_9BACT|nr:hypothetical protein [Algoriphagus pacificus]MBN7816493.1 hypothetical protein [Algoriphagus pacificus]
MKIPSKDIIIKIVLAVFIIISFFNPFYSSSLAFEDNAAKEISESILILEEIETVTIPLAENIPFLKSWAHVYENDFDKLLSYLNFADLLLLLQLGLLKISEWWFFKILLIASFVGLFVPKIKGISLKLLFIGLLITPGLGIYTQLMSGISHQMEMDLGTDLKNHLQATKDSINSQKSVNKEALDSLESIQKEKHKGKLSLFNKVEDDVISLSDKVSEEINKLGKDLLDILRFAGNHGLELVVSLISNIIIVFVLFPVLFWYLVSLAIKQLFNNSKPLEEIDEKLKNLESISNIKSDTSP